MNHAWISRQLSAYLDGELTAADAADVRAHLAACAICRADLEDLTRVKHLLGSLPERVPPERFWTVVRERAAARHRLWPAAPVRSIIRRPAALAAAMVLVVALVAVPLVRGRVERLRAAGAGVDLYVREHAIASATDPFADRAYIGLLLGDAGLALAGVPRGGPEEEERR